MQRVPPASGSLEPYSTPLKKDILKTSFLCFDSRCTFLINILIR
nr:MAG TPA: hypothetical protein [Caudoviricetes sp.]